VKELFRDIAGLGEIAVLPSDRADTRVFKVGTSSSNEDLLDLLAFHVSREHILIRDLGDETGVGLRLSRVMPPWLLRTIRLRNPDRASAWIRLF